MRVCHLTSAHPPNDVRIFHKECRSLATHGFDVTLIAPGQSSYEEGGVKIEAIPPRKLRAGRFLFATLDVFVQAVRKRADVYHFHDPELIFAGIALKLLGRHVIYDVHENLPRQILTKEWIPGALRRPISLAAAGTEWVGARFFDRIVTVTREIASRFPEAKTALVQNFPHRQEWSREEVAPAPAADKASVVYMGVITRGRGAVEMVKSLALLPSHLDVRLQLVGEISPAGLEQELRALDEKKNVDFLGWQSREALGALIQNVRAGLVLFHPHPNHVGAQPNKLFEYMAAGIPLIASNFPLWREIIKTADCGLLVDPMDSHAIARAIAWVIEHPSEARAMGERGREAILQRFNWECEENKLIELYRSLPV